MKTSAVCQTDSKTTVSHAALEQRNPTAAVFKAIERQIAGRLYLLHAVKGNQMYHFSRSQVSRLASQKREALVDAFVSCAAQQVIARACPTYDVGQGAPASPPANFVRGGFRPISTSRYRKAAKAVGGNHKRAKIRTHACGWSKKSTVDRRR